MAIEAPYSKYSKTNFKIAIAVCIGGAIIFAYDGYLSKYEWSFRRSFYEEHVKDGKLDSTLVLNRSAPLVLGPLASILAAWFWVRRREKLIADENELIISTKEKIPYDSIQKIDRTYFSSKDYIVITYKKKPRSAAAHNGVEVNRKLSARKYDNLEAIWEHLAAKIS
jgi:hypothetical protein